MSSRQSFARSALFSSASQAGAGEIDHLQPTLARDVGFETSDSSEVCPLRTLVCA